MRKKLPKPCCGNCSYGVMIDRGARLTDGNKLTDRHCTVIGASFNISYNCDDHYLHRRSQAEPEAAESKPTVMSEDIRKRLKAGISYNDFVKDWVNSGWLEGIAWTIDCLQSTIDKYEVESKPEPSSVCHICGGIAGKHKQVRDLQAGDSNMLTLKQCPRDKPMRINARDFDPPRGVLKGPFKTEPKDLPEMSDNCCERENKPEHLCCGTKACQIYFPPESKPEPNPDKCQYCGAGRVVRSSGEWQFHCHCDDPEKRPSKPEPTAFISEMKCQLYDVSVKDTALNAVNVAEKCFEEIESQAEQLAAKDKKIEQLRKALTGVY